MPLTGRKKKSRVSGALEAYQFKRASGHPPGKKTPGRKAAIAAALARTRRQGAS